MNATNKIILAYLSKLYSIAKNTTNEEITAFLYRAIKCKFNSCFIVGGIELLEFEQNSFIIKLFSPI